MAPIPATSARAAQRRRHIVYANKKRRIPGAGAVADEGM